MKQIITFLFVGLFGLSLSAQDKIAKIEFESETIDYGTINKGADGIRVFKFKNTGTAPLIITRVKSSCGCTVPKKPDEPVLPGMTGEIEVKYDTNRVMPIRKTITVTSNAETPTIALKIKGLVVDPNKTSVLENKNNIPEEEVILSNTDQQIQVTMKTNGFELLKYYLAKPDLIIDFSEQIDKSDKAYIWTKNKGFLGLSSQFSKNIEILNIVPKMH